MIQVFKVPVTAPVSSTEAPELKLGFPEFDFFLKLVSKSDQDHKNRK